MKLAVLPQAVNHFACDVKLPASIALIVHSLNKLGAACSPGALFSQSLLSLCFFSEIKACFFC
jgi:hypothetical protein